MAKKVPYQSNGNVLKLVVREVVQEELKPIREEIKQLHGEIKTTENKLRDEIKSTAVELRKEIKTTADTLRTEIKTTADTIIERLQEALNDTFQKYRDETLSKMSEMVAEIKAYREEQTAHQGQHNDLTERVENLEAIHPQGQHPA